MRKQQRENGKAAAAANGKAAAATNGKAAAATNGARVSCELDGRRYHATFDAARANVVVELDGIFTQASPVAQSGELARPPRWLPAEARALLEAALKDEPPTG